MIRTRLSSPLRWLSAIMGSLMLLSIASIAEAPLLMLPIPIVAVAFLVAPAVGIYRHEEQPVLRATVRLEALAGDASQPQSPAEVRYRLILVNETDITAADFRIRLLIPHAIVPPEAGARPLGAPHVGAIGVNWFIDSMADAIAITFRTALGGAESTIISPPRSRLDLADLVLPAQAHPLNIALDYQVSGGSVKATLGRLWLENAS